MQGTLYFSNLAQRRVLDPAGHLIGVVLDLVVSSGDIFPRVTGVVVDPGRRSSRVFVPIEAIEEISADPLRLLEGSPLPGPLHLGEGEARLGRTFLDKQIVDTHGVRVVRVNDLKLAFVGSDLRLLGADVGASGLARRLHAERALKALVQPLGAQLAESVIPWNFVDPLSRDRVHLNVTHGRLKEMRPADLADVLEQLPAAARSGALADLSDEQIADTLSEVRPDVQVSIIEQMEDERASDILERMAPDDAVDLLQDLEEERREDLLERMEPEERQEIAELLQYPEDSAGGIMTPDVVRIPLDGTTGDAIELLREFGPDNEAVYYLYVVDDGGRLVGVVSLRSLVTSPVSTPIRTLLNSHVHRVQVDEDQEDVAEKISHYNLLALPVVDPDGVLLGVVTIDDVIDVLREEATEDLALLSSGTSASDTPAPGFTLAGAAWLLFIIAASVGIGAGIMDSPWLLRARLPLLFIPLLLEGANSISVGLSTVIGRALDEEAPGDLRSAARNEMAAGFSLALLYMLVALVTCFLWPGVASRLRWGAPLALFAGFSFGELCGGTFPFLLDRLNLDPVWGVRPLLIGAVSGGAVAIYLAILHGLGV